MLPVLESMAGCCSIPSQYEGEEQSPQVIYTGATPQQQALPAVDYLLELGRRRFFLLGTDFIYPRTTNAIIRNYLASRGIGERRSTSSIPRSARRTGTTPCSASAASPAATASSSLL